MVLREVRLCKVLAKAYLDRRGLRRPISRAWSAAGVPVLVVSRPCQVLHAKQPRVVGPDLADGEAGGAGHAGELLEGVLVRVLGADRFAGVKLDGLVADVYGLVALADQLHLDASGSGVPDGAVFEVGEVEVGGELAVEAGQQIQVKCRGDAFGVVVGAQEHVGVLAQVDADEQAALGAHEAADRAQQLRGLVGGEVADRRAREVDDGAARGQNRRREGLGEVGADRDHGQACVGRGELVGGVAQEFAGDVDGHVAGRGTEMVEDDAGLGAAAAAELEQQGLRATGSGHLGGVTARDHQLGAGRIVLGERADLVEEPGAVVVVKILAGQGLRRGGQARERVAAQVAGGGREVDEGERPVWTGGAGPGRVPLDFEHGHLARRSPLNCQRASGGKKLR